MRYIPRLNLNEHPNWKGGLSLNSQGYVMVTKGHGVRKRLHVEICEKALGKPMPPHARIHHVDGNKQNNAPSNLVICDGDAYHALLHARQRIVDAGGHPDMDKICGKCRRLLSRERFSKAKHQADGLVGYCIDCERRRLLEYYHRKKAERDTVRGSQGVAK